MRVRILLAILLMGCVAHAQKEKEPNTKFGKISPEDLKVKVYSIDSSAPAVVLFDVGQSDLSGNNKFAFATKLEFRHRKRTHILNKNGYGYAEVVIPQYKDGSRETVMTNLKAVTYNLEGDKVVETKLEKSSIFKEQIDKNRSRIKFTFPAVKEGSVIEYEYTIQSDYVFTLMPWEFQGSIPRLWSEYRFSLPQFYDYIFLSQGYFPFHIKENKDRTETFSFMGEGANSTSANRVYTVNCNVTDYRWVMKNVPVLKQERFTSTLDNHIAKIEFQLSGTKEPFERRPIMSNWSAAAKELMEREDFGRLFLAPNNWLDDEVKLAINGAKQPEEKARNIYAYVRDRFTCTDYSSLIPDQNLRAVVKNHKGTVSELNLLLVAMLRSAGIKAEPVVLSTRENGYANAMYPLMNRLNYVVCRAELGENSVFLDASHSMLGFGKMMYSVYNGAARVINEEAPIVDLLPESLLERKTTFARISNVDGKWMGHVKQIPGYYESYSLREKLKSEGKESYEKTLQKTYANLGMVKNLKIDSLKHLEEPVAVEYELQMNNNNEDILYINPLLGETVGDNPFKSAERAYPVEMPYAFNETYIVNIEVPEGYELEEAPKGMRILMNEEGDGQFDYLISFSGNVVSMRVYMKMERTFFLPDEYEMLREFFNRVVSKQSEQIVFKKKK